MDVLVGGEGGSGGAAVGLISIFRFSHRSWVFGLDFNIFVLGFFLKIVLGFDFVLVS